MIKTEKLYNALKVIQRLIILAREMVYDKVAYEDIASLLDDIEYLPCLLLEEKDNTEEFHNYIYSIAKRYEGNGIIDIFEEDSVYINS